MSMPDIPAAARQLPICDSIAALQQALTDRNQCILEAPPGSGKTTVLPLALMNSDWLSGRKILLLEPRRLAARGAALRMAELLGESAGQRVGYRMRLERKVSAATQIEVITEGMLTRQLQQDPELSDVGLIIFDEFHERSLQADLGLALSLDVQSSLREDLRLLVMSATLNSQRLQRFLPEATVIQGSGQSYPVELHYLGGQPTYERRALVEKMQQAVRQAVQDSVDASDNGGNMLCFLPGQAEIVAVQRALADDPRLHAYDILPLYGALPAAQQNDIVRPTDKPSRKPRIILSTAIAESSLTIPGIRVVIDAGLSRQPRFDANSGLVGLYTRTAARANIDQRSGRAGRLSSGRAYRLWSEHTEQNFDPELPAEILQTDLASLRLELAQWGCKQADELRWLDTPNPASWQRAEELLLQLGALTDSGALTPLGSAMSSLSTQPRLAAMLIKAAPAARQHGCDLAALLQEGDPLRRRQLGSDIDQRLQLITRWRQSRSSVSREEQRGCAAIDRTAQQLSRQLKNVTAELAVEATAMPDRDNLTGSLLLLAYPDRLALAQANRPERLKLANGRGGLLAADDPLLSQLRQQQADGEPGLLLIADMNSHERDGQIRLAAAIEFKQLQNIASERELSWQQHCQWDEKQQRVIATDQLRYYSLTLLQKQASNIERSAIAAALLDGLAQAAQKAQGATAASNDPTEVLSWLPWDANNGSSRSLLKRVRFLRSLESQQQANWPDWSAENLIATLPAWLGPYIEGVTSRNGLQKTDLLQVLLAQLDWPQQQQLDTLAPTHWQSPQRRRWKIDYPADGPPVLAIKLQELFGVNHHPQIANGQQKLMLHLLSPARRPIQVTQDLDSFWERTYAEVRKELRGRYPKHAWPENPKEA